MKWLVELKHWKDTREDNKIGTGEGLEPIQVGEDGPDDILEIEDMGLIQKIQNYFFIIEVTLTENRQHIKKALMWSM